MRHPDAHELLILNDFITNLGYYEDQYISFNDGTLDKEQYVLTWGLADEDEIEQSIEERESSDFWHFVDNLGWSYDELVEWQSKNFESKS